MAHDGHHHGPHDHHHHHHAHAPIGHNGATATTQWQTPHLPEGAARPEAAPSEPDLDLVETAFLEAFPRAPDPTSFLRLAGIPFIGRTTDGRTLNLLRVEASQTTDVGSVTPHLGGEGFNYTPLPAAITSRRDALAFVYQSDDQTVRLALSEAKALTNVTPSR